MKKTTISTIVLSLTLVSLTAALVRGQGPMWWQQIFPNLPEGWVVQPLTTPMQGLAFMNTKRLEYVKLSIANLAGADAVEQLNNLLVQLRQQFSHLQINDVRADAQRKIAGCQIRYVADGGEIVSRVILISGGGQAIIVSRAAQADLYPQVQGELEAIAWSLLQQLTQLRQQSAPSAGLLAQARTELGRRSHTVHVGLYWITIPSDWRVLTANGSNFVAISPGGEIIAIYNLEIPADRQTLELMLEGLNLLGLSPEQYNTVVRLVSPYLPPVEVIRQLYPQVSGGEVQNVQVLEQRTLPSPVGQRAEVHYRYFHSTPTGSQPMEGMADVTSTPPPITVPGATFWTVTALGAEAPPTLFQQNLPLYVAILSSARPDPQGIQTALATQQQQNQIIKQIAVSQAQHFQQQNQLITQTFDNMKSMQMSLFQNLQNTNLNIGLDWLDTFGGQTYVKDVETGARFTVPNEYMDFFRNLGEAVRAYGKYADPLLHGSHEGDILQPIHHGE
jgi:hypothetical protein